MATYTWIGAAGGLYATTTNWSPAGLPTTGDDIIFTGDATPNVSTTARTVRNLTVNGGTVTFSGTGAFTIQGDISNGGQLNMNTMTVSFTGGANQTLSIGGNSFTSCTINKTVGTRVTLNAAWNITGTAAATLTVTAGDLYTQGYTVTCQLFAASGNTDRTIDLAGGAIYVTGVSGTLWNTSHTTATGTAWTKFARSGAAYIQPSSGTTTLVVTGGGIASNYTAGATFNGVPPTFQLGNNRNYTATGQFENLEVNGNFAGTSTPQIWGNLTGTPVSYNNVTTTNPVIIGRTGVTNTVSWRAQVTSYTTQNPLNGTPTFTFDYARAVTFTLSTNTSTYNLWIDGNDTTGAAWQTAAFTVVCSGNNSTYNENIIRSTSTLTYTANGTGSTYGHQSFYDNNTASAYTFGGNASTVHHIYLSFDTLGTVNFNFGTLNVYTTMYCRIFTSATGTGASGNQRIFNFNNYWIYINGNHRSGTNGTGTLSIATLNNTVCTSDSGSTGGGFWLQTTGTCTTGSWQGTYALRFRVEALAGTTLNASITACNLRSLEFFGPVNFTAAQTINLINDNASIYWNEQGSAFDLRNLTATIAAANGGTVDILRNGSSGGNANWRLGTLSTLDASLNNNQTFNIYAYVRTLSLTKNTGTFYLHDVDYAQTVTCSGGAGTNYYHYNVRTSNPFTATFTPITGTSVAAAITKFQVPVKSTSGSGSGATFNIAKTGTGTTYSGITVAGLGSGYTVNDTITISGAQLNGADGTNDLTFTITAATQYTMSGQSAGSTPVGISGTAVNTAQTRTNVPVKSSTGGGNDALFSVTKTGTGVVYFGVTTAILTSGTAPADGSTIVLSGANLGGADGTNDLTFTFRTATQHIINSSNLTSKNTFDYTAGDLEIAGGLTLYCRTFQSTSTTNIREWRWNGWVETSGTGLVSIGSAGANIRGNFLDTYSGGFRAVGTGANAFGTNVLANAPRVQLGNNDGSLRTYASVAGNMSHLIFQSNDYAFTAASSPTIYGNISFNYYWAHGSYGTWTNLTINWQPLRNGADLQLYSGYNFEYYGFSPTIPTLNINTPVNTADNEISVTLSGKFNTVAISTTHNYNITTGPAGLSFGTSLSITGNNCTFNFNGLGSYNQVANPAFTLGAATSTNNIYNLNATNVYYTGPNLSNVDITQLGGTSNWNTNITIRDLTFTGPGVMNLDYAPTLRNFSSSNSNARTLNMGGHYHSGMSGNFTISTGTNLTIVNPGTVELTANKTINTSGLSATNDNNFSINWTGSGTFTTGSAIRNLYIYSNAVLSTSSAITVNIRGQVTGNNGTGGTGPFTGLTISFPAVATPGNLTQLFNVETPTVIPSVTVLGTCTINAIRTTTLTLNPGPGYTATLDSAGHITTLTMTGTGGTITLNNLSSLQTLGSTSLSFAGNATYNLNGFTSTAKSVSCAGTSDDCVYNLQNLTLIGTGTTNRLIFDGRGTLNVIGDMQIDRFDITNTTVPRTLNFNNRQILFGYPASISCNLTTTTVIGQTNDYGGILITGEGSYTSADNVTVTINGQTESNALNLRLHWVPVTLAGTLAYRTLQLNYGMKNTTGTLTVYGHYYLGYYYTPWSGVSINFAGNDPNKPQEINTSLLGPNTATMSGLSPKIVSTSWIKTLTTQNTTVVVPESLYCDEIIVQGTTFKVGGTIYTNYWNNTDPSTYYWRGPGYLHLKTTYTADPAIHGFLGDTNWTSGTELFNSTSSRGAGTGPNLIMDYKLYLDASTTQDPHRVRFLRRENNFTYWQTSPIKISERFEDVAGEAWQLYLSYLNLIFDPSTSSQNNFRISSTYNMNTTGIPITIPNISSSNSTMTIEPTSSNLYLNKIEFDDTANTNLITNSKNLTTGKIICGNAEFGNSVVTLTGGNDTIFDTGVVAANSIISAEKNYSTYLNLDFLRASPGNLIVLSSSSFTIECWVWSEDFYAAENATILMKPSSWQLYLQRNTQYIGFYFHPSFFYTSTTELVPYIWNHIAVTFNNSTSLLTIYLNGINILQTTAVGVAVGAAVNEIYIGYPGQFKGFIKDVRIVKDAVVYANNFANNLPTQPLEVHSSGNTLLLTCQNSTIIDNSSNPKTLEAGGTVTRHLFSPTPFASQSEIVTTGLGNKNFIVRDNNLNVLTNNSPFYHTGNGDGVGWLNLVHTEPRTIGTVKNGTGAFSKGIVCSATLKDVTATNIGSDVINVIEGSSVTFYVSTNGIADNTTLYWTNSGTANSTQLGGASSGSFTVLYNQGLFTINVPLNAVTSSTTTIIIQVRTESTSGTIIATSLPVTILNTTYSLAPNINSATEGDTITWTVTTTGVPNGTVLYWTDSGSTDSSDWVDGAVNGTVTINNNIGTISRTLINDLINESNEISILQIRSNSITGTVLATSASVTVISATILITSSALSAVEGDTITWTITTTRFANGTVFYWTDSGSTNSSDWVGGAVNGTVTINNNTGTISRTLVTDAVNENNETSILQIRSNSITGTILVTNQTINILNQAFSVTGITTNLATAYEDETITWTVTTTGIPNGTALHWTDGGSTSASDWFDGAVNGTVTINNNTGIITRMLAGDLISDSNETSILQIRTGGINGPIRGTASTVNILEAVDEQVFNVPGTYTWTAPAGVTSVSVVAIGGGGRGGRGSQYATYSSSGAGGGGLGWKNNISVIPGNTYTVVVGAGGSTSVAVADDSTNIGADGENSYFIDINTVAGFGGKGGGSRTVSPTGGGYVGDGGGTGGRGGNGGQNAQSGGGGGAGGYTGNGGDGGGFYGSILTAGSGGGGGGGDAGWGRANQAPGWPGGGVGIMGIGSNGGAGSASSGGGGSGGLGGNSSTNNGGLYGGGSPGGDGVGSGGAVRIIWGSGRSFPNNAGRI